MIPKVPGDSDELIRLIKEREKPTLVYGDLQRIAGKTIQQIEELELSLLESDPASKGFTEE